ncbi:mechanosensitive ion channel family protein [Simplicispira psychrophila]|uniref:mechanosensitive ion channel family protein n=1 Tax=Simplicispira psychrophila TaxID=80882 RepID=UPI00068F1854|nr:mechanosensitive ion channel domain-containing protein [Simplicispira psychrophila]
MLQDLKSSLHALLQAGVLIEIAVLLGCVGLAWGLSTLLRRAMRRVSPDSILFGHKVFDGALFPLLLLGLTLVARAVLQPLMALALFKLILPVLLSLSLIRVGAKVLQAAFPVAHAVRVIEHSLSWLVWCAAVLWITGVLPLVLQELDDISWKIGSSRMSLRTLLDGIILAGVVLLVALWISSVLESWLLRSATGGALSLRKALSNAVRALLIFIGLIVALSAVGIDLTTLSVLGGAVGVGIGLGLQKLAANYVSGFVILAERSIRIGDNVRVDSFEGRITAINGRYTLIQSTSGRESIVPNEMLITSRVENLSLADTRVWLSTVVSVGYDSDVDLVMRLLKDAALAAPRVLHEPAAHAALSAFGADGLEFTLGFWIADPENGALGLRSQINVAILQALRAHGIDIPYPQRVVHLPAATVAALAVMPHPPPSTTTATDTGL